MLKEMGYTNGHFGKWHLGDIGFHPEDSGFDVNVGGNRHGGPGGYFAPYPYPDLTDVPNGEYLTYPEAGHPVIFTEAKEFAKDVLNFINKL